MQDPLEFALFLHRTRDLLLGKANQDQQVPYVVKKARAVKEESKEQDSIISQPNSNMVSVSQPNSNAVNTKLLATTPALSTEDGGSRFSSESKDLNIPKLDVGSRDSDQDSNNRVRSKSHPWNPLTFNNVSGPDMRKRASFNKTAIILPKFDETVWSGPPPPQGMEHLERASSGAE